MPTIDISVLILFFNRADHLSKVFAEVKKARPTRLFLYQDGPREGRDDMPGILACRELVSDEQIDWECEVHRNYQERNYGCDPSGYLSQQWAFSLTDKCIVLEDDVVPSQSFFPFCKELLDRYENDPRITLISGFNTEADQLQLKGDSYFFTRVFSIWGWASWSRVILNRDGDYGFVNNPQQFQLLKEKVQQYHQRSDMPQMCIDHARSGKQYFESIFWAYMLLHDGLAIIPSQNLINNIGMEDGTHFSAQLGLLPRRLRHVFTMPRKELTFPLQHPTDVVEHPDYQRLHYLRNAWNNPWRKVQYSLEELWLNLIHGNFRTITHALQRRVRKWLGTEHHR
jgi:hypothetical protein